MESNVPLKKKKICFHDPTINSNDPILENFVKWMNDQQFTISKNIQITKQGSCARYGLVAVENIRESDILFCVPRTALLWEENCSIADALAHSVFPPSESGWVKLILCLMLEYTKDFSHWGPYMKFMPSVSCVDQPMFWPDRFRSLLKGTGLNKAIEKDIKSIEKEFTEVALPFIRKHSHLGFDEDIHSLALYKHMVSCVMSYSFTEPNEDGDRVMPPVMVPFADALNHISKNNAQLEFEKEHLKMVATSNISKGSEIFNTYGKLSNLQLLQMYGFVENYPNNMYDTVDISLSFFFEAADQADAKLWVLTKEKRMWLQKNNLEDDYPITVGLHGVLSCSEFKLLFKVMRMTKEEFVAFKEDDEDWESDDSDSSSDDCEFEVYSFLNIKKKMNVDEKEIIRTVASNRLQEFNRNIQVSNTDLQFAQNFSHSNLNNWRALRAKMLVNGQCNILQSLIDSTDLVQKRRTKIKLCAYCQPLLIVTCHLRGVKERRH